MKIGKKKTRSMIKSPPIRQVVNILLIIWLVIWLYFAVFNWGIFTIRIQVDLGFAQWNTYPFILFFVISLIILLPVRYLLSYSHTLRRMEIDEKNNKIAMQEKDIEILRLRERLYQIQSEEKSGEEDPEALRRELENISQKAEQEKKQNNENTGGE